MDARKTALLSLCIMLLFVALPATFIAAVDPCHIYHRPLSGLLAHGFSGNARCQNAGLISTYLQDADEGFSAIFIGSSLSGNFLPAKIAASTPWQKTLKLTLPGSKPVEQQILFTSAMETGKVQHVFWEIFPQQFLLHGNTDRIALEKTGEFPAYLYNQSRLDDYRYLFNASLLSGTIDILAKSDYYNIGALDKIDFWQHDCNSALQCKPFYSRDDIEQLRADYHPPQFQTRTAAEADAIDFSAADRLLLASLLPYCNSNTSFDLLFPPLSLLWYARQDQTAFDYQLYMLRHVVAKTASCRNIRVFSFSNELWITGDLAHYHDPRHFYGGVQDYIIEAMGAGKHIITPDNITAFEQQFVENVNNYLPHASTAGEMTEHQP